MTHPSSSPTDANTAAASADPRPKTVVLQQYAGIGDFVWHIPYFREIARQSLGGKVSVISQPSTLAHEILAPEPWLDEVIYYDHRRRKNDRATPRKHGGLAGLRRMARELRERGFDRALLFTHRPNRAIIAWLAGIPRRSAYGFGWLQRLFLNEGPFIKPYKGPSLEVYKNATAFAIAHGFCSGPLTPRMSVPEHIVAKMRETLAPIPRPFYAFSIGTSEPDKQWGRDRFAALAAELAKRGRGVLLSGGPNETALAREIVGAVPEPLRKNILPLTQAPVLESAAALGLAQACVGNDTGSANMAAARGRPVIVILGARKRLDHDPLVRMLTAPKVTDITVSEVLAQIDELEAGQSGAQAENA